MKNTVTMAELMKKVNAYGQPQNLDEGFASDAQRRALRLHKDIRQRERKTRKKKLLMKNLPHLK